MRATLGLGPVEVAPLEAWFAPRIATIVVATAAGDVAAPAGDLATSAADAGGSCDPIGFVEAVPGELRALYVLPALWGRGAADALHARAIPMFGPSAVLTVFRDNARARRFYERTGWVLDGDDAPRDFDGVSVPFVRYRR